MHLFCNLFLGKWPMDKSQWIRLCMNVSIYKKDVEFLKIIFKQIAHSTFNSARGV